MSKPCVSVIIPAYNSMRYIEEAIQSVLIQSFTDFEVLVIDDGSTDDSREKILNISQRDERVRYIRQANQGVSAARNHGFNLSSGELIAFLDSDDAWLPNNLELKVHKILQEDFGLVHSDAFVMDENSKNNNVIMKGQEGWLLRDILLWNSTQVLAPSSILVKRHVVNNVGLFDTHLSTSADHDFFIRVAALFRIGRVPQVTWHYRIHGANMHKNISLMEHDILYLYSKASKNEIFVNTRFKRVCFMNMYLMMAASWAGDGKNKLRAAYFILQAFATHPYAIANITNRLKKKWQKQ
jgi:glycosyltransferase involved in cell wall biosynthesis